MSQTVEIQAARQIQHIDHQGKNWSDMVSATYVAILMATKRCVNYKYEMLEIWIEEIWDLGY